MPDTSALILATLALGEAAVGFRGRIVALDMSRAHAAGLPRSELERRLLGLGFGEGAGVEPLHQGLFGGDPIAVRVADATTAPRRRAATAVLGAGARTPPRTPVSRR